MTGPQFKSLREALGYTAAEVAAHLARLGTPVTTERSVYRLQQRTLVPERYVIALRDLAGSAAFESALSRIMPVREASVGVAAMAEVDAPRRRRRAKQTTTDADRFVRFLNALPTVSRLTEWINLFREALRELLGDVDRVTVNVNYMCNLNEAEAQPATMVMTEHIGPSQDRSVVRVDTDAAAQTPTERLLEQFRSNGYRLDRYWPPVTQDYYFGPSYLGSILLWRERSRPQVSRGTEQLFRYLEPFIRFALTDVIARHHQSTPFDKAFDDAFANLWREARLSERESRTLLLLLLGHSYKEIAASIPLSLDAVRKHMTSIYRKTGTRSIAELFAKYFTHRRAL